MDGRLSQLVSRIGAAHNVSGADVALKWVLAHGVPLSTKSTKEAHLRADLALFDWELTPQEVAELDAATSPAYQPSFMCKK